MSTEGRQWASVPGTCGELFQGTLEGQPCLVSLPINRWAWARVRRRRKSDEWRLPPGREKTRAALELAGRHWAAEGGFELVRGSQLLESKGFGSSTADIASALYALAAELGREVKAREAVEIATAIEPTDSSPLSGLALLDHRQGDWCESLGRAPALAILIVDTGGSVDTQVFNRIDYSYIAKKYGRRHAYAYSCLTHGIARDNLEAIGRAATISARIQQRIMPKPAFSRALQLCQQTEGVGICVAHSGTLIGLLYPLNQIDRNSVKRYVRDGLPPKFDLSWSRSVDGGVRWQGNEPISNRVSSRTLVPAQTGWQVEHVG